MYIDYELVFKIIHFVILIKTLFLNKKETVSMLDSNVKGLDICILGLCL